MKRLLVGHVTNDRGRIGQFRGKRCGARGVDVSYNYGSTSSRKDSADLLADSTRTTGNKGALALESERLMHVLTIIEARSRPSAGRSAGGF